MKILAPSIPGVLSGSPAEITEFIRRAYGIRTLADLALFARGSA
jgi:hypothetical protein